MPKHETSNWLNGLTDREIESRGFIVERESAKRINVLEPLSWKAPSIARPYCCYISTVIFYVYPYVVTRAGNFQEWDRVEAVLCWDREFLHHGERYKCGGGRVIRRRGQWWMKHWARKIETPHLHTSVCQTPLPALSISAS